MASGSWTHQATTCHSHVVNRKQQEALDLGARIRDARERMGLLQSELATLVGTSSRTVGNWERGETSPRNKLGKLEDVLGVALTVSSPTQDRVVAAIESSDMSPADQHELIADYLRILERRDSRGA